MNIKTVVYTIILLFVIGFFILVTAAPVAAILLTKEALTTPSVFLSCVAFPVLVVGICSATMTSLRATPDKVPPSVGQRQRALFGWTSLGIAAAILFGLGVVIGLLNANFSGTDNVPRILFSLTAMLMGTGGAAMLIALGAIWGIHILNAGVIALTDPSKPPEAPPKPTGSDTLPQLGASADALRQDLKEPILEGQ